MLRAPRFVCAQPLVDDEEIAGIDASLGAGTPIAAPKLVLGETLGAGGAVYMPPIKVRDFTFSSLSDAV